MRRVSSKQKIVPAKLAALCCLVATRMRVEEQQPPTPGDAVPSVNFVTLLACTGFHFFKSLYQSLSQPHHQSQSVHRDVDERVSVTRRVTMIATSTIYNLLRRKRSEMVGGDAKNFCS